MREILKNNEILKKVELFVASVIVAIKNRNTFPEKYGLPLFFRFSWCKYTFSCTVFDFEQNPQQVTTKRKFSFISVNHAR